MFWPQAGHSMPWPSYQKVLELSGAGRGMWTLGTHTLTHSHTRAHTTLMPFHAIPKLPLGGWLETGGEGQPPRPDSDVLPPLWPTRSSPSCPHPSSTRLTASWATSPTARRTTDREAPAHAPPVSSARFQLSGAKSGTRLAPMRKLALRPRESCPHRGCHPVTAASLGPGWGVSRPCLCLASFPQPLKAARRAASPQLEGGEGWTGTPPGLPQGSFLLTMLPDSSSRPLSTTLEGCS